MKNQLIATVKHWSTHRYSVWILASLSFIEAIFFPIPPDVMLLPMMVLSPDKTWFYALVTTVASVVGGILAYGLGYFCSAFVKPWFIATGFGYAFTQATLWFKQWGVVSVTIAGFTPIPFKVFTLTAGLLQMNFPLFILSCAIGRSLRFGIEAFLVNCFGFMRITDVKRVMIPLSWSMIGLFLLYFCIKQFGYA